MKKIENIYSGLSSEGLKLPNGSIFINEDSGKVSIIKNKTKKSKSGTPSLIEFDYPEDDTDNLIKLNGNPFMHTWTAGNQPATFRNMFIGESAGNFSLTGIACLAVGSYALAVNESGNENIAIGAEALGTLTSGAYNTAMGGAALYSIQGSRNTGIGRQAGVWVTSGTSNTFLGSTAGFTKVGGGNLTTIDDCVLIGSYVNGTQGSANEIVIGKSANGNGSNTVTLGNTSIAKTFIRGTIHTSNLQTFADDTAAASLNSGDIYKTATGELRVKL